ncbi:phage tail assembly protein [Rosenbergiella australiborealis]|uniref:phage tail assembly protein n=1 Tax=Rosenbergiella australiborealis TaxID=1544696 RepID=UPI001F4E8AE7|nr:phage tail assembly protein [Rosenbergiella australiborealis]
MYPSSSQTIILYTPLTLANGSQLTEIALREPTVRDRILREKDRGSEGEKDARMLALLCNMNEEDIYALTAADYLQLEEAFNVFMLPPSKRPKQRSSPDSAS